jgi:taurine dioxygenase
MTALDAQPVLGTDISEAVQVVVRQKSATIGAVLSGVNVSSTLSGDAIGVIRQALLDWKVLFFDDRDITTEQHLAFGRRFSELEVHPFAPEKPYFHEALASTHDENSAGFENLWRSDVTWRADPSLGFDPAATRRACCRRRHAVRRHKRRV